MRKWVVLLAVFVLCIFFLPMLLSTKVGTRVLERLISTEQTTIKMEGASFSWLSDQKIRLLTIASRRLDAELRNVTLSSSFFSLLFKQYGDVKAQSIAATLKEKTKEESGSLPSASITADAFQLSYLDASLNTDSFLLELDKEIIACLASGHSRSSRSVGTFSVSLKKLPSSIDMQASCVNFPMAFATFFTDNPSRAIALLGDRFSGSVSTDDQGKVSAHLQGSLSTLTLQAEQSPSMLTGFCLVELSSNVRGKVDAIIHSPWGKSPKIETATIQATAFPLFLLSPSVERYLGDRFSGRIEYTEQKIAADITTPRLRVSNFSLRKSGNVYTMERAASLSYLPPPSWNPEVSIAYPIKIALSSLTMYERDFDSIEAGAQFEIPSVQRTTPNGLVVAENTTGSCSLKKGGTFSLEGASFGSVGGSLPAATILSGKIPLYFTANGSISPLSIPRFSLEAKSPSFNGSLVGKYTGDVLECTDGTFHSNLDLSILNGILRKEHPNFPAVAKAAPVKIEIDSIVISKEKEFSSNVKLSSSEVLLENQNLLQGVTLKEISIDVSTSQAEMHAKAFADVNTGSISLTYSKENTFSLFLKGKNVPTTLFDTFHTQGALYQDTLGPVSSFTIDLAGSTTIDNAEVLLDAPLLSCALELESDENNYVLQNQGVVKWTVTPQGFLRVNGGTKLLTLRENASVILSLNSYVCPKSISELLSPLSFSGSFSSPYLPFLNAKGAEIDLNDSKGSISFNGINEPMTVDITSKAEVKGGERGDVYIRGTIDDAFDPSGRFSLAKATATITGKVSAFPTSIIDQFALQSDAILPSAFLGDFTTISLEANLKQGSGPIAFTIDTPQCKANVDGLFNSGVMTLQKPVSATFRMTKELSRALLGSLSVDVVSLDKPVNLYIDPRKASLVVNPFSLSQCSFAFAALDLGQMRVENRGTPTTVGDIFELKQGRSDSVHLWFAPLVFSLDKGKMQIQRTEILYDGTYDIALWGSVDLLRKYASLTLGLTAQSLHTALGLRLPKDYVMQVPFRGPLNNVKLDKGAALAKIAFIVAREAGKQSTSPWGNVLGLAAELADDQSKVPPPKHPFPWESPSKR